MNAQLGNDTDTWKPALGSHAEGNLNGNGIRLLSFCLVHNLFIGSSMFPHKKIHKLTWNSLDGKTVNQIDHTVINRRWRNSLKDVRVYRGADIGSDHNLAVTTIRLSLAASKQQKKQLKYDFAKLLDRDILQCFDATVGGKFHALVELEEEDDIDKEWNHFSSSINEAAKKELGYRKRKQEDWISTQSRDLIAKRKEAKPSLDTKYKDLNRETKASLRYDKKAWYARIADDIQQASANNNIREVYQKKNILIDKTSRRVTQIRDSEGNIIKD